MTFIFSVNHVRLPIRNAWRKLFLDAPFKLSARTLQYRERSLFGLCRWIYRRILWRRLVDMYIFISLIRSYFVSLNGHRWVLFSAAAFQTFLIFFKSLELLWWLFATWQHPLICIFHQYLLDQFSPCRGRGTRNCKFQGVCIRIV